MLHIKFQGHRSIDSIFKVFTMNMHGDHVGHVTLTVKQILFPQPKEAVHEIKFELTHWI